jgi:hypothetical protein
MRDQHIRIDIPRYAVIEKLEKAFSKTWGVHQLPKPLVADIANSNREIYDEAPYLTRSQ